MSIQSEFKNFNDRIRLDYKTNSELASKRDILLEILEKDENLPSFKKLDQGSYAMYTGVKPGDDREYDIDVGLRFNVSKSDYNPMDLKKDIEELLKDHTDYGAKIKKSCVTVTYKKDGEPSYHVDLVVYVYEDKEDKDSQIYIAKGINSDKDSQKWEMADPKGLVDYINDGVERGEQRDQFRRVLRYIKRWKHRRFAVQGHCEPPSIGLNLIALDNFIYYEEDDFNALTHIVDSIVNKFVFEGFDKDGDSLYRIKLPLPMELAFEFDSDVFGKMTDRQMTDFKEKAEKLQSDLNDVESETDEHEKYKKLQKIFGEDFEVPEEEKTAKKQYNYIPSSSSSGME
ncbi:nucleotidyltransferase domain-containing protein [Garciella nitratireducens]|jgi:hypothetical protein|uniref:nucleotidyltransferase domain-containing protein n=1 Tax=Garciella nitratireducens TaxID=218205 RepID=UPI000DEB0862|nr:nucleotidyltransferase [Garciella nitratireducens]RBP42821.1 hypothetical protein DFR81_10739 [Garciella nitratireducens]